jgi:hypothetical protein
LDARVGRDGKVRPLDRAERRAEAERLLAADPRASLRDIGRQCGLSPETVRDVRSRMSPHGGAPLSATADPAHARPAAERPHRAERPRTAEVAGQSMDLRQLLKGLTSDPSIRSSELGRTFLRALAASVRLTECGEELAGVLPDHCRDRIALAARLSSETWQDFASVIKDHPRGDGVDPGGRGR